MIHILFEKLAKVVAAPLIGILTLAGYSVGPVQTPVPAPIEQNLGASSNTPTSPAFFESSLASSISSSATSFTLVSGSNGDGGTLASSTYGMVIDEGTASQEMVLADCTGTSCTNVIRGLSNVTATTTIATKQFSHRRGAPVKITTGPSLVFVSNIFSGKQNIEFPLNYNANFSFALPTQLVSKKYVDDTAFSGAGVIDASAVARGVVELATQLETASSSVAGSSGNLAIPSSNATSTYNSATAPLRVVVTQNNGKIDSYFISTSTLYTNTNFSAATTTFSGNVTLTGVASSTIGIASTTAFTSSFTWAKPANLKYLVIEVVGGGGSGGGGSGGTSNNGGGGCGGGYAKEVLFPQEVGATETVTVGAGGAGSTSFGGGNQGGTSSFGSYLSATGGGGGQGGSSGGLGCTTPGSGSGGDVNLSGGQGTNSGSIQGRVGIGGVSVLGSAAGGGSNGGASNAVDSSAGAAGMVIITEYYY